MLYTIRICNCMCVYTLRWRRPRSLICTRPKFLKRRCKLCLLPSAPKWVRAARVCVCEWGMTTTVQHRQRERRRQRQQQPQRQRQEAVRTCPKEWQHNKLHAPPEMGLTSLISGKWEEGSGNWELRSGKWAVVSG